MDFENIKKSALLGKDEKNKNIKRIFDVVLKNFEELQNINTEGLEPADFPYELKRNFLREDKIKKTFPEDFKKNIDINAENFVVLKGVEDE